MLLGATLGNDKIWMHGAMLELGFELIDSINIIFNLDVWGSGAAKPDLKGIMIFHHIPSLIMFIPVSLYLFIYFYYLC